MLPIDLRGYQYIDPGTGITQTGTQYGGPLITQDGVGMDGPGITQRNVGLDGPGITQVNTGFGGTTKTGVKVGGSDVSLGGKKKVNTVGGGSQDGQGFTDDGPGSPPVLPRGYPDIKVTGGFDTYHIDQPRIYTDPGPKFIDPPIVTPNSPKNDPPSTGGPIYPPEVAAPKNPCLDLYQYGHVLWDYGFQWKDEVINFISKPEVTRIAASDALSFQTMVNLRNDDLAYVGRKFKVNCTDYYIKDFLCDVQEVSYSTLSRFNVALAKFTLPKLRGDFYITSNGRLCTIDTTSDRENKTPDIGDRKTVPPYQPPTRELPPIGSGNIYGVVYSGDIITETEIETKELWCSGSTTQQNHWRDVTASLDDLDFCLDVYSNDLNSQCTCLQYRIFYGDYDGKGAIDLGGLDNETLTKAIYSQFANILLPQGQSKFVIDDNEEDYIYVIDVKRDRYGTSMDTGNWELNLGWISSSITTGNSPSSSISFVSWKTTGSYVDSSVTSSRREVYLTSKTYDVVQGTLEDGINDTGSIGIFYPNHGIIVLAGSKMDSLFNFNTNRNIQKHGLNPYRLFTSISGASAPNKYTDSSGDPIGFKARKLLINYNNYYFIRVKNQLFNYSNNPTYISGSEGLIIDEFKAKEKSYITSIGLYNSNKELLAVAKLPKPYLKSASEEALFNIKVTQ